MINLKAKFIYQRRRYIKDMLYVPHCRLLPGAGGCLCTEEPRCEYRGAGTTGGGASCGCLPVLSFPESQQMGDGGLPGSHTLLE